MLTREKTHDRLSHANVVGGASRIRTSNYHGDSGDDSDLALSTLSILVAGSKKDSGNARDTFKSEQEKRVSRCRQTNWTSAKAR